MYLQHNAFLLILVALYIWWWPSSISFHLKVTPTYQTMSDWLVPLHHQGAHSHLCSRDENLKTQNDYFLNEFSFFFWFLFIPYDHLHIISCLLHAVSSTFSLFLICDGSLYIPFLLSGSFSSLPCDHYKTEELDDGDWYELKTASFASLSMFMISSSTV